MSSSARGVLLDRIASGRLKVVAGANAPFFLCSRIVTSVHTFNLTYASETYTVAVPEILFNRRIRKCQNPPWVRISTCLLIGSAQPAHARATDCWFWEPTTVGSAEQQTCDVTLRTEPSLFQRLSTYLVIRDQHSDFILEAVLWEDDRAELTFVDRQGNVTAQVEGTHWVDSDGDTRIDMTEGYQMAFTRPTSDYGAGAAYPPALGGGREHYQPTRGGGLPTPVHRLAVCFLMLKTFSTGRCGL